MRIAYISDTFVPETNGIVTAIVRHARGLRERGHKVLVLCPRYERETPADEPDTVDRFAAISPRSNPETRMSFAGPGTIARRLRAFGPDIVHVHTPLTLGVAGVIAARRLGVPLVQTYHSYVPGFMQYANPLRLLGYRRPARVDGASGLAWILTRAIYGRSDLVLTPSDALSDLLRAHGVTVPIVTQTNGIDLAEFPPKTDWSLRRRVIHCGRLGWEKNAEVILAAFARFSADHPGWELHVLGEGPALPFLRARMQELGIADRVRLEGFVSRAHLAESYREADIYATASTIETQGLVVLEAMASGTPVVGVNALAVPEMVSDGLHGIMVQPSDAAGMAAGLASLADDDALRETMGRAGVGRATEHDLERAIGHLERTYEHLLAERRHD
jgi:glycosyltransferase involved in cell wall biosynthesis